jgi:alkyl hydroperoxide reductase subunit F
MIMLDADIREQLSEYLKLMEGDVLIKVSTGPDEISKEMNTLLEELGSMSSKIRIEPANLSRNTSFSINRIGEDTGVTFAGIPLGHEFTS